MSTGTNPILTSLIDQADSCFVLVDVQKVFLDKLPEGEGGRLAGRIIWLAKVAQTLGIPFVVTAEDIEKNGSIVPALLEALPRDTKIHNKMVFNLAGDPSILRSVEETNRKTLVLAGLETDVCVAQSALGLLEQGYKVAVVEDATAAPGRAQRYGLARIQAAGALLTNVKSLFYEWMRGIPACRRFYRDYGEILGEPDIEL